MKTFIAIWAVLLAVGFAVVAYHMPQTSRESITPKQAEELTSTLCSGTDSTVREIMEHSNQNREALQQFCKEMK